MIHQPYHLHEIDTIEVEWRYYDEENECETICPRVTCCRFKGNSGIL